MQTTKFSPKEEYLSKFLLFTNWHCVAHFRIIYGWELNILTSKAWGYSIIVVFIQIQMTVHITESLWWLIWLQSCASRGADFNAFLYWEIFDHPVNWSSAQNSMLVSVKEITHRSTKESSAQTGLCICLFNIDFFIIPRLQLENKCVLSFYST